MAIANVALSDTFETWRLKFNESATAINRIDDEVDVVFLVANTSFAKGNAAHLTANTAYDKGNAAHLTANTSYNKGNAAHLTANTAYDKANSANYYVYLVDANTTAAFIKGNAAHLTANTAYNKANAANYYVYLVDANTTAAFIKGNAAHLTANTAYNKANAAHLTANTAYNKANAANYYASLIDANTIAAFDYANTVYSYAVGLALSGESVSGLIAQPAYNKANSANYYTFMVDANTTAAFIKGNAAHLTANTSYNKGNAAHLTANTAYDKANAAHLTANTAYDKANAAHLTANTAYDKANAACTSADTAQTAADAAFARANSSLLSSSYTASDVFNKVLSLDGSSSTLDADLLDGQHGSYYSPLTISQSAFIRANTANDTFTASNILNRIITVDGSGSSLDADLLDGQHGNYYLPASSYSASDVLSKLLTVDGAGTGLDSDLLDGQQGAYYSPLSITQTAFNKANTACTNADTAQTTGVAAFTKANTACTSAVTAQTTAVAAFAKANTAWTSTNDGAGSGLDADLLDGQQGSYYAVASSFSTTSSVRFGSLGIGTAASGTTGEIRATNNITAYYSSDKRLKENIKNITDALNKIMQINGVTFDWTSDYIENSGGIDGYFIRKSDVGVIAQELQKVLPEAVAERSDGILAVKYDRITSLLIEAIKELKQEVDQLKNKVGE